jgi:hypothetical protein
VVLPVKTAATLFMEGKEGAAVLVLARLPAGVGVGKHISQDQMEVLAAAVAMV